VLLSSAAPAFGAANCAKAVSALGARITFLLKKAFNFAAAVAQNRRWRIFATTELIGDTMAEENKTTTQGGAVPADAQRKFESGKTHARKAAADLKSAAGVVAEEYRGRAEEVWDDAKDRVRTFQEDSEQYIRENPTKAVFTALGIGFVLGLIFRR
jgi:ElaB/YqjD/DUF883 family membrane-anchored ribosome-binding protein